MAPPFRCEHCEYVGPSVRAFRRHLLGRHHMRTDPETGHARPVSPERLHLMLEAHRRDRRNPQQRRREAFRQARGGRDASPSSSSSPVRGLRLHQTVRSPNKLFDGMLAGNVSADGNSNQGEKTYTCPGGFDGTLNAVHSLDTWLDEMLARNVSAGGTSTQDTSTSRGLSE